ncbi:MAG: hypothetical protein PHV30_08805 [Candidatus Margulisbacteria bacterium]|nr:hypothetical protein [Candidatus Margulisiibacteriota bacterium]
MEKIIKKALVFLSLAIIFAVITGCTGEPLTNTDMITIQGTYKLPQVANGSWNGIVVNITGPESFSPITTLGDGKFTVNVKTNGVYTIVATKSGYMNETREIAVNVNTSKLYDLGNITLINSNPPPTPNIN